MPLHVFEPRYREMFADALEGDSIIGMVMLRPGWEDDYEGNPAVYGVGGAGIIERVEALSDGRYNIALRGTTKFRIRGESRDRAYRRAAVDPIPETLGDGERVQLAGERDRLEEALEGIAPNLPISRTLSDVAFVNTLVQYVSMEGSERQSLVEAENALTRARLLMEILGVTRRAGRVD